jgi:hypothetical protein
VSPHQSPTRSWEHVKAVKRGNKLEFFVNGRRIREYIMMVARVRISAEKIVPAERVDEVKPGLVHTVYEVPASTDAGRGG